MILINAFLAWNTISQMNWTSNLFCEWLAYCVDMFLLSWLVSQRFLKWLLFELYSDKLKAFSSYFMAKMAQIKLKCLTEHSTQVLSLKFWFHIQRNITWLKKNIAFAECWNRKFTEMGTPNNTEPAWCWSVQ